MPLLLHRSQTEPFPRAPFQQCAARSQPVLPLEAVTNLQQSPSVVPRRSSHLIEAARMATAKLKQHFHHPHGPHRLFRTNSSNLVGEHPVDEHERQKERNFLCCYECNQAPLSPGEISDAPQNKEVGTASKNLRIGDFELMKTIGTGISPPHTLPCRVMTHGANAGHQVPLRGCGSRVWLVPLRTARRFSL